MPANSHSEIYIPAASAEVVKESGVDLSKAPVVNVQEANDGWVHVQVGSGIYHFTVKKDSQ